MQVQHTQYHSPSHNVSIPDIQDTDKLLLGSVTHLVTLTNSLATARVRIKHLESLGFILEKLVLVITAKITRPDGKWKLLL